MKASAHPVAASKVAVLSNIHGVLPALESVLAEPEVADADRIVLADSRLERWAEVLGCVAPDVAAEALAVMGPRDGRGSPGADPAHPA